MSKIEKKKKKGDVQTHYPQPMARKMTVYEIAEVAHEVNREYCRAIGDNSQKPWDDTPVWQVQSACAGVRFHLANPDAGPEASHESWLAQKEADGWIFGKKKNEELQTHPCMVPFNKLKKDQKAKDYLFRGIVHALKKFYT